MAAKNVGKTELEIRKAKRRRRVILAAVLLSPLLWIVTFSSDGIISRFTLESELREMKAEIVREKRASDSLRRLAKDLETSRYMIEKLARERYGMVYPGETVFQYEDDKQ